ncbi:hypothetical protein [Myroides sp.]|uniref:hypothetical protein n=1 Tax=Myroides sp. TaxID=1874736 RepID=UPI0028A9C402|nr:hypothetical protein [Myroides sp.]
MIKYLFNNTEAFDDLCEGKFVEIEQIKRSVLLELRKNNVRKPDHLYRLQMEDRKAYFESYCTLLSDGLGDLSNELLELRDNRLYVNKEMFFKWEETITFIPPGILIASKLSRLFIIDREKLWKEYILPNTKYTMLLSPHLIQLEKKVKEWGGLDELHIHLNGSLEADKVWQDFIQYPFEISKNLEKVNGKEKPLEQFSQEGLFFTPKKVFEYLTLAKALRNELYEYLMAIKGVGKYTKSCDSLWSDVFINQDKMCTKVGHPYQGIFDGSSDIKEENYASLECLMLTELFIELRNGNECVAKLLYSYLLVYSLSNRLLVHQLHQNGFEQFQKITLNELREFSESSFNRRFYQFAGNDLNYLKFIEGRVSPKDTDNAWYQSVSKINKGWSGFEKQSAVQSDLCLIAHFIKEKEKEKDRDDYVRYYGLRKKLFKKGHALRSAMINDTKFKEQMVGVDAASSEFDTPPEVFGPVFRMMRNSGIKHFTYHAGEDFYHIVTGIRAVYEAILFCELTHGDRIGHAVALGLDAVYWGGIVGDKILMRSGDYLDDLVFLSYVIKKYEIESLYSKLNLIKNKAESLYFEIYGNYLPIEIIIEGWKVRGYCPIHFGFHGESIESYIIPLDDERELVDNLKKTISKEVRTIYEDYHNKEYDAKYNKKLEVQIDEFLSLGGVSTVQKAVLRMMNRNEIVIETLPMSNVRIGFHQNFGTYHLWNWVKWKKEGEGVPPIVIGSDDTGIFATNIYNEYANVYLMFIQHCKLSHTEAIMLLEEFKRNGDVYKFN